jgi:hypothetical protein
VQMNRSRRPGSSTTTAPMTVATTITNAHADSQLNSVTTGAAQECEAARV